MSTIAFDSFALTRIADFARSLSRLHQASRRKLVDDDEIDREFNAVCLSVWGYTTDAFSEIDFDTDDVTDGDAAGVGASLATMSAVTGATFISPSRARTSAVSPG